MYKLFYSPGACSMAVHVALHENGLKEGSDFTLENAGLHAAYSRMFFLKKNGQSDSPLMKTALDSIQSLWNQAEAKLGETAYLAGDVPTVGDVLFTVIANWQAYLPSPMVYGPNTKRLLQDISSRPAYQAALTHEGVEYKAAA